MDTCIHGVPSFAYCHLCAYSDDNPEFESENRLKRLQKASERIVDDWQAMKDDYELGRMPDWLRGYHMGVYTPGGFDDVFGIWEESQDKEE